MPKMRIAVIGAGWWAAENHIPVLKSRPDVEVTGVCRLGSAELSRVQEKFGIPFGTEDYRELLAHDKPDGVIVSSPHNLHYEHAAAALEAGVHVLCEKPMVLHGFEARQLVSLTESRKLHFVIPYGWNYTDYAQEARDMVRKGEIGNIEHVLCYMGSAVRELFSGGGAWFVEKAFFKPQASTWSDPNRGGGFAHGQLTHALALLFWMADLNPAEVFALMGHSKTGSDLYNAISCRFTNGATAVMGGAATMPPRSTYQVDIRVFGSEGMLLLDIERPRLEFRRHDGRTGSFTTQQKPGAYSCVEPVHAFVDLIQGKPVENRSSGWLGAKVVGVLEAAFRSAKSGKMESVEN
jgi:predicted dehydrogenase